MVYTALIKEYDRDFEGRGEKHYKIVRDFNDKSMAMKYIIDFLVHIMEEGIASNKVDLEGTDYRKLFERKDGRYVLLDRCKGDLTDVGMLCNMFYMCSFHNRIVQWELLTDDPREATEE